MLLKTASDVNMIVYINNTIMHQAQAGHTLQDFLEPDKYYSCHPSQNVQDQGALRKT